MDISSSPVNVLQSIQGPAQSPRQQIPVADTTAVGSSASSQASTESTLEQAADNRPVVQAGESSSVDDSNERLGRNIDLRA